MTREGDKETIFTHLETIDNKEQSMEYYSMTLYQGVLLEKYRGLDQRM
jgi:hypothetical protein